jgi:hypothetical protein
VSLRQLAADVAMLKIDVAMLLTAQERMNRTLAVHQVTLDDLGLIRPVVTRLEGVVSSLLDHAANVTACAAGGDIHIGDGACVDPVPRCPRPMAPSYGAVALSADFIIPGVTATYTCGGANMFLSGPTVRTCNESLLGFNGAVPECLVCGVVNCLQCVDSVNTCATCALGHD